MVSESVNDFVALSRREAQMVHTVLFKYSVVNLLMTQLLEERF